MSAATTPNASTNGSPAVNYVRALSSEEKEHVLIALLRELIEINGGGKGLIPISTPEGESLGYYVPPQAAQMHFPASLPSLSVDQKESIRRATATPQSTFDMGQFLDELSREGRD